MMGPQMNDRLIIVGGGWAGKTIASTLLSESGLDIVGFVEDKPPSDKIIVSNNNGGAPFPVLGHSRNLVKIAKEHNADSVVIAITHDRDDHLFFQIIKCYEEGITVHEMPDLYAKYTHKIPVHHVNHHWIAPKLSAPTHDLYDIFHDSCNYLISLFGFVCVFLPILPLMAIAIKLDSKGPVFFKQKRVGKRGRQFNLLKFRTMIDNAHKNGTAWTAKDDDRITRVGKWLRRYRLDELPQLINVLIGDMALIGPRPEAVELVEKFNKEIPFYEYRYLVLPGATGWAQVNYENTCSVEGALEKLQYDLYWIKNRSFWLDLKIIFKSFKVMLTGFGAV